MMLTRSPLQLFFISLIMILLLSCAGQVPPEGGPVDTDPPLIISTIPPPGTTLFSGDRVILEFDEYVDRRSVEQSIFVSPPVGSLEFDWSGREVEITFSDRLRENTTYVVNIGTDVVDLRNRNKMAQAFSVAFSTGGEIDFGAIEGKVYTSKPADAPQGVMIFAYRLDGVDPDTLNPRQTLPDYVTQTGKGGDFFLRHLALGTYRVLAVRDEFRNLLYDPEADEYGVPSFPLSLTAGDTLRSHVLMRLAKEDTTAPRLVKATPRHSTHLLIEFSEPIHPGTMFPQGVEIVDTVTQVRIGAKSVVQILAKPATYLIVTEPMTGEAPYRVITPDGRDFSGNKINPLANASQFTGSVARDSIGFLIASTSVSDSARGVAFHPEIQLLFSTGLDRESGVELVTMQTPGGEDVPVEMLWLNDGAMIVQPIRGLAPKSWYKLTIKGGKLRDHFGNKGRDTTRVLAFETLDPELLSGIEGRIVDDNTSDTSGVLHLFAENVTKKDLKPYQTVLPGSGRFEFQDILEGLYVLHAYRDRNGNKRFDVGRPIPFERSERFVQYPDTLRVRPRWPLEGVVIELR
jgi:hypothetical protein